MHSAMGMAEDEITPGAIKVRFDDGLCVVQERIGIVTIGES